MTRRRSGCLGILTVLCIVSFLVEKDTVFASVENRRGTRGSAETTNVINELVRRELSEALLEENNNEKNKHGKEGRGGKETDEEKKRIRRKITVCPPILQTMYIGVVTNRSLLLQKTCTRL